MTEPNDHIVTTPIDIAQAAAPAAVPEADGTRAAAPGLLAADVGQPQDGVGQPQGAGPREPLSGTPGQGQNGAPGHGQNGAAGHGQNGAAGHGQNSASGQAVEQERGTTAAQLRRFIKSRPYVPLHELRRRFELNGDCDDVVAMETPDGRCYIGLPEREGRFMADLVRQGEVGVELGHDPEVPIVVGVFPMRPVGR